MLTASLDGLLYTRCTHFYLRIHRSPINENVTGCLEIIFHSFYSIAKGLIASSFFYTGIGRFQTIWSHLWFCAESPTSLKIASGNKKSSTTTTTTQIAQGSMCVPVSSSLLQLYCSTTIWRCVYCQFRWLIYTSHWTKYALYCKIRSHHLNPHIHFYFYSHFHSYIHPLSLHFHFHILSFRNRLRYFTLPIPTRLST